MEKNKFNGFDSQERYDKVSTAVYNAMLAFGMSWVEFIPKTQILCIYVEYGDYYLDMSMNLFDGLFSVVKYKTEDNEESAYLDKTDLDIIRRAELIADEVIDITYLEEFDTDKKVEEE